MKEQDLSLYQQTILQIRIISMKLIVQDYEPQRTILVETQ